MNKYSFLITDDEKKSRDKIKRLIINNVENPIIIEAENGKDAAEKILESKIDVLFLDIQMPIMSGLEMARIIGYDNLPLTIFITAYDEHAVTAFEMEAIDYLLKPFDEQRFLKSLNKAIKKLNSSQKVEDTLQNILKKYPFKNHLNRIMVKDGAFKKIIETDSICYFIADEKYVHIITNNKEYLIRSSLSSLLERLDNNIFFRIHKSYAVNIKFIKRIEPLSHGDQIIIMNDDNKLIFSRNYKDNFPISF